MLYITESFYGRFTRTRCKLYPTDSPNVSPSVKIANIPKRHEKRFTKKASSKNAFIFYELVGEGDRQRADLYESTLALHGLRRPPSARAFLAPKSHRLRIALPCLVY